MAQLELLGCGVLLSWLALAALFRLARPQPSHAPAATYRRLLAALLLSCACLGLPWLRARLPQLDSPLGSLQLSVHLLATTHGAAALGTVRDFVLSPFALLGLLWLTATASAVTRLSVARLRLYVLLARATPAPREQQRLLERLAGRTRAPRARLLLSAQASAPFSVGSFRPVVVLPAELPLQLPSDRLGLVLRHELVHLRRLDPLTNGLARLCATAFILHPAAARLLRELVIAREAAVDAEVAVTDPRGYASLLLELAGRLRFGQDPAHVSMDDTALARRIAMLTQPFPHPRSPSLVSLLLAAAAIAAVSLLAPRVLAEGGSLPAPLRGPFNKRLAGHEPLAAYQGEIDECYELARAEDEDLIIDTLARFDIDPKTYRVRSAHVPTPESPVFQACVEERATSWSLPPPPDMPRPPRDLPRDARLMIAAHIAREP
jgi:beta-lactamase regulating signal transducer with metallopeptidase domain